MIPLEIVIDRAGSSSLRLTAHQRSLRFSTAAVGGFAACSFDMPGDPGKWKREIPKLSVVRVVLDTFVIWEGQVEDHGMKLGGDEIGCTVQCYGPQRRLDEVSVRRIWSKRDFQWSEAPFGLGAAIPGGVTKADMTVMAGTYDLTDLTKAGVRIAGNGVVVTPGGGQAADIVSPIALTRIMGQYTHVDTTGGLRASILGSADGTTYAAGTAGLSSTQAIDATLPASTDRVRFYVFNGALSNITPAATDHGSFSDIRLLGTSLQEDASGGFYGGTILRDLIALVPGLSVGIIDTGSDFTIQAIERAVRSSSRSVIEEVAGYYTREWRVWEDGQFDWKAVNRDEPQWVTRTADLQSGSELTSTVDSTSKTLYVLYSDAATQRDSEASAAATSQQNPWVKQGRTKDELVSPGFPMTTSTSAQLASRLSTDSGSYPAIQGRLVLPAMKSVARANGPSLLAFQIRAGENIIVPDLPKTDLFASGRDGETLFHIVATEADLEGGMMTLEVEGQDRIRDQLLARLAAVTRTVGG